MGFDLIEVERVIGIGFRFVKRILLLSEVFEIEMSILGLQALRMGSDQSDVEVEVRVWLSFWA